MAITPYSTPTQYQYKPLNLMAFAEPLMKMQEKYDLTKASLEESDVKATALQWAEDPIKAKELETVYRTKRDELITNLMETKNYTQAASKLKQLNKLYQQDPERVALESNYKLWEERNKEELARVGKPKSQGGITKDDYLEWVEREKGKFIELGGTSYRQDASAPTGTYNPVTGKVGRETNLQEDLDEAKLALVKAAPGEKRAGMLQSLGLEALSGDAEFMQTVIEEKDPVKVAANVEKYLRTLDKYKPWLAETADYKFYNLSKKPEELQNKVGQIASNVIQSVDRQLASLEKDGKKDTVEYQQLAEYRNILQEGKEMGFDERAARNLFQSDLYNQKYGADELAQIFGYKNIDRDFTFRDIPKDGTGSGSGLTLDDLSRTSPTTKELTSFDLQGNIFSAKKEAKPHIFAVNNIDNGNMRTLVMGKPGSTQRRKMESNYMLAVPRQEQIIAIRKSSKNATEFHRNLYNAGFTEGNTLDRATSVFNALNPNIIQTASQNILAAQPYYTKFQDNDNILRSMNSDTASLPEFQNFVKEQAERVEYTSRETVAELAKKWNTTVEKLIDSGVVEYKAASTGTAGNLRPETFAMKSKFIAKASGFNTLQEAVEAGFDFRSAGSTGLSGAITQTRDEVFKKNFSGQEMGVKIVGSSAIDKALQQEFVSTSDLTSYVPAINKSWQDIPGFDEDGKLLGGTKLAASSSPKIVLRGNNITMVIPYTYKEGKNTVEGTIEVLPKPGQNPFFEKAIRAAAQENYILKDQDKLAKQSWEGMAVGGYNLASNSKITPQSAQSVDVNSKKREVVLETSPTFDPNVRIQIVKKYTGEDSRDEYEVRTVSAVGTQVLQGKFADVNAAKVYIYEQRDLNP